MSTRFYFIGITSVVLVAALVLFTPVHLSNLVAVQATFTPETTPTATAQATQNLYPVEKDGKWGYIDATGKLVIQPQYDCTFPFSEGLAAVCVGNKIGYIDTAGKLIIQPQYDFAYPFSDGL